MSIQDAFLVFFCSCKRMYTIPVKNVYDSIRKISWHHAKVDGCQFRLLFQSCLDFCKKCILFRLKMYTIVYVQFTWLHANIDGCQFRMLFQSCLASCKKCILFRLKMYTIVYVQFTRLHANINGCQFRMLFQSCLASCKKCVRFRLKNVFNSQWAIVNGRVLIS